MSTFLTPTILNQPLSRVKERGTYVDFTVIATNTGYNLTYQWRKDGTNITDATNKTFAITSAQTTNVGSYTCVVSGNGFVTSEVANLSVYFTYIPHSVAGTLIAPVGAFATGNITVDGQAFDRVSSNYFSFYGPNASPQVGNFQNTTYMPKLTVDTFSPNNLQLDTGIQVRQMFFPYGTYSNNNGAGAPTSQPKLSKYGPITLATSSNPDNSCYRVTVYYRNATLTPGQTITFNWLYHQ